MKNANFNFLELPSGQLSYTCCVMVATDADGTNRNS